MIPFGTFMQATGSMPAMGKGGTGIGSPLTANNGFAQDGSAQAGGEASDSFSAWVRKLTGDDATMASDGDVMNAVQDETIGSESTELDVIGWDQLMAMIADAMETSPELSDGGQGLSDIDLAGIQDALQQLANTDLLPGEGPSLQVLTNLVRDSVNGSDQVLEPSGKPTAGVQGMPGSGQEGQTNGQGSVASGATAQNGAMADLTAASSQRLESGDLAQTQDEVKKAEFSQALQAQQNKEKPVSPVDPTVAQPVETAEEETPERNAQRLNDGTRKAFRGDDPVSSRKDSPRTQPSLAVPTGKDDGNATAADEDGTDNRRAVRTEIQEKNQSADAAEKELPKATASSDQVKTANPEQNRFSDAIQDATRTMTEKSGAIQTAPSERTEATAAQRFQATVMDQIVDKANLRSVQGRSEIQIRLKPDFLGNVQMNIAADKEQVVVRMITDHPVVKEVVEANLHHLKTELQHQGLTIDRFEVTVNPDAGQQQNREQFAQMFKNPSFQNGRRQGSDQEPETNHRENGNREDGHPADAKTDGVNYFA